MKHFFPTQDNQRVRTRFVAVEEPGRPGGRTERVMGYGMCRLPPAGHCNWFVASSAGDWRICAQCGHMFDMHD